MSWVTVIWSMIASACLTLALVYGTVWWRRREARAHFLFAVSALGTACFAGCEIWMMRAETPGDFGLALRWLHVPAWAIILALVGFVRLYLRAGRPWLAWTVCGLRTISLLLNFLTGPNLNYREITALRSVPLLGELVSVAEGVSNPWMLVGQLSLLLLVIFTADATIAVWRRGDRRQALLVGGTIVLFTLAGTLQAVLFLWGLVPAPLAVSLFYMGIVAAMGFELSLDALRAEQLAGELRESEQQLALASESVRLGVWRQDLVRNEIWASAEWRTLFGFTPSERLEVEMILQRLHPDDRAPVRQALANAIQGNGDYEMEFRLVRPDGRIHWIDTRGRVQFNPAGRPILVRGVSLDVTMRKTAEAEALQQREELAHLSRVTTVSELSGSLAHELNQPLAIILTNAQAAQRLLAQQPPDVAEAQAILADIVSEDQRAGEVIRRLRSLLQQGETLLQPLALNQVVEEVLQLARNDLIRRSISVSCHRAGDLPPVRGDFVQLQQVLLNLIINAGDAMAANPPGGRQLTLTTMRRAGVVRVSVADNGSGLPPDVERVFEPFYTTKSHGLGLGLSICRTIITAHQGRLWAEMNAAAEIPPATPPTGPGAIFHVELPSAEGAVKTDAGHPSPPTDQ